MKLLKIKHEKLGTTKELYIYTDTINRYEVVDHTTTKIYCNFQNEGDEDGYEFPLDAVRLIKRIHDNPDKFEIIEPPTVSDADLKEAIA